MCCHRPDPAFNANFRQRGARDEPGNKKFIRQTAAGVLQAARSEVTPQRGNRLTYSRLQARIHDAADRPTSPVRELLHPARGGVVLPG